MDHLNIDNEVLQYVREGARRGVRTRYRGRPERVSAKPHASARAHMQEAWEKIHKDLRWGRVLLCTTQTEEALQGVYATPMGRVVRKLPDGSLSSEGRFISDKRGPNLRCDMLDHPPNMQPRHREIVREVLFWKKH